MLPRAALLLLPLLLTIALPVQAQLSGSYTIGGTAPDYSTIGDAISDLSAQGVNGAVVFNLRDGVYLEQNILPAIAGASATNTITFQSESGNAVGVMIQWSPNGVADNYVLQLDGADHIHLHQLTMQNTASIYGRVLQLTDSTEHNRFTELILIGIIGGANNAEVVKLEDMGIDNAFVNNTIQFGGIGIDKHTGASAFTLTVDSNTFVNQHWNGLFLQETDSAVVRHNRFVNDGGSYISTNHRAIWLNSCEKIWLEGNAFELVEAVHGIYAVSVNQRLALHNNMVYVASSDAQSGIFLQTSDTVSVYHNSVLLDVANPNPSISAALWVAGTNDAVRIQNNLLSHTGADGLAAYYLGTANYLEHDYNIYHSPDTFLHHQGQHYSNMASYLTDLATTEQHSHNIDPVFSNAPDLHEPDTTVGNLGIFLPEVSTDLDGDPRSTSTPDVGADEWTFFAPLAIDTILQTMPSCYNTADGAAQAMASGGALPYTWSWSTGSTSDTIHAAGNDIYNVTVTDSLGSTATQQFVLLAPPPINWALYPLPVVCPDTLGSVSIVSSGGTGTHSYLWSTGQQSDSISGLPPGSYGVTITDADGCTDTATATLDPLLPFQTTINTNPASCEGCCDGSASANIVVVNGGISYLWNTGDTTASITDLCAGVYTVTVTDGQHCTMVHTDSVTEPVGIDDVGTGKGMRLFPVPATSYVTVQLNAMVASPVELRVMDLSGRMVLAAQMRQASLQLDVEALESGLYVVELIGQRHRWQQRLIVLH